MEVKLTSVICVDGVLLLLSFMHDGIVLELMFYGCHFQVIASEYCYRCMLFLKRSKLFRLERNSIELMFYGCHFIVIGSEYCYCCMLFFRKSMLFRLERTVSELFYHFK